MLTESATRAGHSDNRARRPAVIAASLAIAGLGACVAPAPAPRPATQPAASAPVAIVQFSGDLGGQNACRDSARGYPIFAAIAARPADAFVALGDMIYADGTCAATGPFGNPQVPGPAAALDSAAAFDARWRYNLADPGLTELRASRAYIATWDDHEIVNDFGPQTARLKSAPEKDLLAIGRAAFFRHNPVARAPGDPARLYRRERFGDQIELFVLDTRQYRDRNDLSDTGVLPKSLLGAAQRRWLIDGLSRSQATWKLVATSVPISIPTGWPAEAGRDGWASGAGDDGFERELYSIFSALAAADVKNLVWLTADVHFATGFELRPLPAAEHFVTYEWVVGPLSAGIYPNTEIDPTFRPKRLFMHAPEQPPESLDEALHWYNFGEARAHASGALELLVVNGHGVVVARHTLAPE